VAQNLNKKTTNWCSSTENKMKTPTPNGSEKSRPYVVHLLALLLVAVVLIPFFYRGGAKKAQPPAEARAILTAPQEITAVEAGINTQQTEGKTNLATATVDAIAQKRAATLVSLGFDPNAGHKVGVKYETHKDPSAVK
jgi:hypothetical protein